MMKKKRNHNSVLLGMLICVVIALVVTVSGFWIMRKQLNETKSGQAQEKYIKNTMRLLWKTRKMNFGEMFIRQQKHRGKNKGFMLRGFPIICPEI